MTLNVDTDSSRLADRVRQLEHTLDVALIALDAAASMREREAARCAIREALKTRRSLSLTRR